MIQWLNEKMAAKRQGEAGFTLIELLVVIIILGVLSGVVVFAVRGTGDKGSSASYATDYKTLKTAQEAFCAKFGRYGQESELVAEKFLSEPSRYHNVELNSGGPCTGAGAAAANSSAYRLTCNADAPACGTSGAVAMGGTLVINNGANAPAASLNPAINSAGGIHANSEDMFNGLLRYEPNGDIGGDLAQTFNFNNSVPSGSNPNCPPATPTATCDATTTVATFVLREGVKFHGKDATVPGDGDTLTPADVEFSFEKAILAAHGRTRAINTPLGVTGDGAPCPPPAPPPGSSCSPVKAGTVVPPEAIQTTAPTAGNGGTVVFNFRQVFAPLKYTLNVTEAPIISKTAYEPCWNNGTLFSVNPPNACPANTSPVGTGPFRFESLNANGITTVKNPDYFRFEGTTRLPYFDKIYKKVVAGNAATSIESGEVDVASIANNDRPRLAANPNIVLASTPRGSGGGNCITTIAFNTTKRAIAGVHANAAGTVANPAPTGGYPADSPYYGQNKPNSNVNAPPHRVLGDAQVREAIFKSLDRNKFWTDIAFSAGRVADAPVHSIFQPNGAYQGPQPLPTFDRTAADALLDGAGWNGPRVEATTNPPFAGYRTALDHPNKTNPDAQLAVPDGTKLALEYLAASGNETFADEVKAQLKIVGIDVTRVTGDNSLVVAPRIFHARTYDMGQISYCNNDEPQFGVRRQYHTDALVQTNAFTNASGYKSTMMDGLWLDASKAPDVQTYQNRFLQIQRLALGLATTTPTGTTTPTALETAQRIPMVQMLESAGTRATLARCTGFNNNNTGLYMEAASCTR